MKRLLLFLLLSCGAMFGQAASFYQFPYPLPGAVFRVCPVPSGGNPCPSPVSIFRDQALTQLITQPVQVGTDGNYGFWVSPGQITIQVGQPYNLVYIVSLGGGGGGTPGGSNLQPQFNNSNAFGGVPNSLVDSTTGRWALNNVGNSRVVTPAYNWSFAPGGSYTGGVGATLTFNGSAPNNVCPLGVNGADANLQVYISGGTGAAEVAAVTGGTCTPGLASGTLTFTPANSHSGAFTVSTNSQGVYEAMKDAGNNNANIYLWPSGTTASAQTFVYTIQGTITVPYANMTLEGGGATLSCNSRGPCIKVPSAGNGFSIYNLRFSAALAPQSATISNLSCSSNTATFTVSNGSGQIVTGDTVMIQKTANSRYWGGPWGPVTANATTVTFTDTGCSVASTPSPGYMIIDNSAVESSPNNPGTHLVNLDFNQLGGATGAFSNELVALNDQDFRVTQMNTAGLGASAASCQPGNYCGAAIFAPGPFSTNPAVIDVSHSNISMNCKGDGIVDWGGNSLNIDSTIIQGTSTTGVFAGPIRGGLVGTRISGIYQENGGTCTNPDYPSGAAQQGIMDYNRPIIISGFIGTNGWVPSLAGFTSGTQKYWYWIVWHDSGGAVSRPMLAATAFSSTGTGSPVVIWPRVMDVATTTYDVLRTAASGPGFLATPTPGACAGGTPLACGSVATAQAQCNTLTCSFTDNLANNTSSYAVPTSVSTSSPTLWFWPGDVIVQNGGSVNNLQVNTPLAITTPGNSAVNLNGSDIPVALPSLASSYAGYRTTHNYMSATIIPNSGGASGRGANANESLKGRLNFYNSASLGTDEFSDVITLVDSTPEVTLTDPAQRPLASTGDTAIGVDTAGSITAAGLALRSPVSITNYINTLPDGASWVERTTSAAKTFKVPVTITTAAPLTLSGISGLPASGLNDCLNVNSSGVVQTFPGDCTVGAIYAATYGAIGEGHVSQGVTWSNASSVVNCASGCNFNTNAKVGQIVFGTNLTGNGFSSSTVIWLPQGTISQVNSNTQITVSTTTTSACASAGNCTLVWGDDETTPLANATAAAVAACTNLQLPAVNPENTGPAIMLTQSATFGAASNKGCPNVQGAGTLSPTGGMQIGFGVQGGGFNTSIVGVTPSFSSASCTLGTSGAGCFFGESDGLKLGNFSIQGFGNSQPGAGFANKIGVEIDEANNSYNNDMYFGFWGASTTNGLGIGVEFVGGGSQNKHFAEDGFGQVGLKFINGTQQGGLIFWNLTGADNGYVALWDQMTNNSVTVVGGGFCCVNATNTSGIEVSANSGGAGTAVLHLTGTQFCYPTVTNSLVLAAGYTVTAAGTTTGSGTIYLTDGCIDSALQTTFQGADMLIGSAANVNAIHLRNTTVKGETNNASTFLVNLGSSAGTLFDDGGNVYTVTGVEKFMTGAGAIRADGHNVNGACTGVGTAASTLGLYGTGPNVTATTCTSTTIGSGIQQQAPGTMWGLIANATAAGTNASSGVVTVLKNGVATALTCTIGTATRCVDGTHSVTYVAGDLLSLQFTTQAADTLAGVTASVNQF